MEIYQDAFPPPLRAYTFIIARNTESKRVAIFLRKRFESALPENNVGDWEIIGEIPLDWNPWGIMFPTSNEGNFLIFLITSITSNPFAQLTTRNGKHLLEEFLTSELEKSLLSSEDSRQPVQSTKDAPDSSSEIWDDSTMDDYVRKVFSISLRQAFKKTLQTARKILIEKEVPQEAIASW